MMMHPEGFMTATNAEASLGKYSPSATVAVAAANAKGRRMGSNAKVVGASGNQGGGMSRRATAAVVAVTIAAFAGLIMLTHRGEDNESAAAREPLLRQS